MNVAIYLRQSLDAQGIGAAVSRQETECRALCERLNLIVGQVYTDNDTSATSGVARPAFEQMLSDRPPAIVVWHQDRLLRLTRDLERVIALDVPVYTVASGNLDLSTPAGRAVARTVATWSQYETEQKALRQRAAHRQRVAQGRPWSTRRPFGFEDDNTTHNQTEAVVIRGMYADILAGKSQSAIARSLNSRGIKTTMGNEWQQSSVRSLLMNPRNAGIVSHNGNEVGPAAWEPIVTEETYRAAVHAMTKNPPRRGGGQRRHLLAGLARCGVCGAKVRTKQTVKGARLYACPDNHVGRSGDRVDELVAGTEPERLGVVLARLSRPDAADLLTPDRAEDVARARQEAVDAREAIEAMAEMFAAGEMPELAFRAGIKRAEQRQRDAEDALIRFGGQGDDGPLASLVSADDPAPVWKRLDLARRRQVIDTLMTIHIDPTRRGARFDPESVRIEWRQP